MVRWRRNIIGATEIPLPTSELCMHKIARQDYPQHRTNARMCSSLLVSLVLSSLVTFVTSPLARGEGASASADGQWLSYGRDAAQQRFSPLREITKNNIGSLGLAWQLTLPNDTSVQATPLEVNGTLYFPIKFGAVYAVDARNGRVKWTFDPKSREELAKTPRRTTFQWGTTRGLAYWKDTLIVATPDGRLISLSAGDGRVRWSRQTLDTSIPNLAISGAPLVFGDNVMIGNAGGDFSATRGYVTTYDANTGKQLWRTFTIPGNPAAGHESDAMRMAAKTWPPNWWKTAGGGNVWDAMTFDPDFNRVYIGTGNGSPWNHHLRGRAGGDNLFVASIVALDASTGKYVWHYQVVPGDNWDFDATQGLVLADLVIAGKNKKVLMQANKDGFFYVIDRSTGKLISAEKFGRATWADRIDLKTGRPIEAANVRPMGDSSSVVLMYPSPNGSHNWPPMSFSPRTGFVYIPGMDARTIFDARGIDPDTYKTPPVEQWIAYSDIVGRSSEAIAAIEADKTEQGAWLQARDPRTNTVAWQVKQPAQWAGGTLATAGDIVFIGQASGDLVGYDAQTGRKLWRFNCGRAISAPPISYELDGKQYLAVLVGWGGMPLVEGSYADPALRMTYRDGGRGLFVFSLGGTASPSIPPIGIVTLIDVPNFAPNPDKVKRGEFLFDNTCNNCHGTDAFSGGAAPDLRASPIAADRKSFGDVVLRGALLARGMPQYVDFSEDDVDSLYQYIRWREHKDQSASQ
jgi:quinohemoprotein ethanol dehydrogenase